MAGSLTSCPICERPLLAEAKLYATPSGMPQHLINCRFCGDYGINPMALNVLAAYLREASVSARARVRRKAVLAHSLRRTGQGDGHRELTRDLIDRIIGEDRLPTLSEQRDNLLRLLDSETEPGNIYNVTYDIAGAAVGAESDGSFDLLVRGMIDHGLLVGTPGQIGISYGGLERIEELRTSSPSGFNAFMAMKFGDPELNALVEGFFKPAVKATGFDLYKLDDRPKAGLIDARLRNDIKQSRFLVVDETHANLGAYWEAGYAEGIGKPVIYTCKEAVFNGKGRAERPHFDTNHHTTILWRRDQFLDAAEQLKQIIRFTIPEARQRD